MAGLPVELFDRAYAAGDGFVAAESPVMYDVWREYATRGPQARPRLLLGLAEDSSARAVAERLGERRGEVDPPSVGVAGEWLVIRVDLVQLVCMVLPLTRWGRSLHVVSALAPSAIVDLLAPLDELLSRPEPDDEGPTGARPADDAAVNTVGVPFSQREERSPAGSSGSSPVSGGSTPTWTLSVTSRPDISSKCWRRCARSSTWRSTKSSSTRSVSTGLPPRRRSDPR